MPGLAQSVEQGSLLADGNVHSSDQGNIVSDHPMTAQTLCNTDHSRCQNSDECSQVHEDFNLLTPFLPNGQSMPLSDILLTSSPLLELGAQFPEIELHQPASVDDVCEEDILASYTTDAESNAANQASSVSGDTLQRLNMSHSSGCQMELDTENVAADEQIGVIEPEEQNAKAACSDHIPSILISDHTAQSTSNAGNSFPEILSMTAESIATHAYDVFVYFNKRWAEKLRAAPSLHIMCMTQTPQSLFTFSARTLQNLYNNILPETFDQVFALMHIAFVFQHVIDVQIHSHDWTNFCHDVYLWQQQLSDPHEAELFDKVWYRQWSPRVSMEISLFKNSNVVTSDVVNSPQEISELATQSNYSGLQDYHSWRHHPSKLPFGKTSFDKLSKGMVVQGCSRFLDGSSYRPSL